MFCLKNYQACYEATALRLTLRAVFEKMGPVRPNAIVIDKNVTKLNIFIVLINDDPWCWVNNILDGVQLKCIIMCVLVSCLKITWMKHLVSYVTHQDIYIYNFSVICMAFKKSHKAPIQFKV